MKEYSVPPRQGTSDESEFSECSRLVTAMCLPIFLLQNMNVYPIPVLLGGQGGRGR